MSDVGQIELNSQDRIVKLFQQRLGYADTLINKAVYQLTRSAGVQMDDLYNSNKCVYRMLRYGISVKAAISLTGVYND